MTKFFFFSFVFFLNISSFSQSFDDSVKFSYLDEHNIHRRIVGVSPLKWSDDLEVAALKQANLIASNFNSADINQEYGVNVYRSAKKPVANDVLKFWVQEQRYYHGEIISEKNLKICSHYTQIIWSQTISVGCAMAQTIGGVYVVVCFYSPKGNTIGQKPVKTIKTE